MEADPLSQHSSPLDVLELRVVPSASSGYPRPFPPCSGHTQRQASGARGTGVDLYHDPGIPAGFFCAPAAVRLDMGHTPYRQVSIRKIRRCWETSKVKMSLTLSYIVYLLAYLLVDFLWRCFWCASCVAMILSTRCIHLLKLGVLAGCVHDWWP